MLKILFEFNLKMESKRRKVIRGLDGGAWAHSDSDITCHGDSRFRTPSQLDTEFLLYITALTPYELQAIILQFDVLFSVHDELLSVQKYSNMSYQEYSSVH